MLQEEARGLEIISFKSSIPVPEVIGFTAWEGGEVLLLEDLGKASSSSSTQWSDFGHGLAQLHGESGQEQFGLGS